jgi:hypothetical protein
VLREEHKIAMPATVLAPPASADLAAMLPVTAFRTDVAIRPHILQSRWIVNPTGADLHSPDPIRLLPGAVVTSCPVSQAL